MSFHCFLGYAVLYALRFNLSVAIVDMVRSVDDTVGNRECSQLLQNQSTKLNATDENGPRFLWTAEQQGLVLGSFFYGYCVTQVAGGWFADKYRNKGDTFKVHYRQLITYPLITALKHYS